MATMRAVSNEYAGSRGPDILGAIVSTYCIAVLAIALRTAARKISKVGFWLDDWLIYAGTVLYTGVLAMFIEAVRLGAGRHIQTVNPAVFETIEILFYSTEIVFPWAIGLVKCSVLAFYWRIFHVSSIRRPIFIVLAAVIAWVIAFTMATIFQCTPPHKLWQSSTPGHCVSKYKYFLGTAIPEVVTDFVILAMPLPYVWKLQMTLKRKLLLSIVFVLGGFASVSSILRLWAFVTRNYASPDLTYTTANPAIWSCVEASIAITSACLPSIRPALAAVGTTYSKLKTKYGKSLPSSSRRISFLHSRSKSAGGMPPLQKELSETADNAKLHREVDMYPISERLNSSNQSTEPDTSGVRSDDILTSQAEVSQDWGYPIATDRRKGADEV
ncbi:hypothetical protein MMC20_000318 [Loxospora ochrophaea]|nr:hypothetical protein [Loxospora ochrophaea]